MQFIEALILGVVQGLTEFLPISSSAHLRILGEFLPSATDPGATRDFQAFAKQTGNELLSHQEVDKVFVFYMKRR